MRIRIIKIYTISLPKRKVRRVCVQNGGHDNFIFAINKGWPPFFIHSPTSSCSFKVSTFLLEKEERFQDSAQTNSFFLFAQALNAGGHKVIMISAARPACGIIRPPCRATTLPSVIPSVFIARAGFIPFPTDFRLSRNAFSPFTCYPTSGDNRTYLFSGCTNK